ncbi:hypothetical protein HXZ94_03050 [Empedobacter falsenii]|uniref:hypothetical protein n=1 Tax=Empedobacter falsenii TaxID=343874 RepID=UPI0025767825|nr:hypothetical protein [Empedobacter falsenii]MDM1297482.1 hypothetical protein [Empedobacter falsenii]MDM1317276.1 hypothetical protein [Empedobacter falsenii]
MKLFSLLFLISVFSFAQEIDTINLKEVALVDYSKYKQFRPKYKQVIPHFMSSKDEIMLLSNFQLPKQDLVEIVAIEFLFESKRGKKNVCSEVYYFSPKIVNESNPDVNLIDEKWFEVEKDYKGKYIFPVNIEIKTSDINSYLLGIQTSSDNNSCKEKYSYFDLIKTKEISYSYAFPSSDIKLNKSELFNHYSLNYKIYYK